MCDGHGAADLFVLPATGIHELFGKVTWDQWGKENQLASIKGKLYANRAPADATKVLEKICTNSFTMRGKMQCIGFNWHAPKGKSQPCALQVVCKKCHMATDVFYPFNYDEDEKRWSEDYMLLFAQNLDKICAPLLPADPYPDKSHSIVPPPRGPPEAPPPYRCFWEDIRRQNFDYRWECRLRLVDDMMDFFDHMRDHGRMRLTLHEYFEEQIEGGAIARGGGVDGGNPIADGYDAIADGGGDDGYYRAYGYNCWVGPQGWFWQDEDG